MTKTELILQIRFGIDHLKASNSTLAFEHVSSFSQGSELHIM